MNYTIQKQKEKKTPYGLKKLFSTGRFFINHCIVLVVELGNVVVVWVLKNIDKGEGKRGAT